MRGLWKIIVNVSITVMTCFIGFFTGFFIGTFIDFAIASTPSGMPSWYEHVDLMQIIIVALILIVAWFMKRDLNRFEDKLTTVCGAINDKADIADVKQKADETANTKEHSEMWSRINHHKHMGTGEVVIVAEK